MSLILIILIIGISQIQFAVRISDFDTWQAVVILQFYSVLRIRIRILSPQTDPWKSTFLDIRVHKSIELSLTLYIVYVLPKIKIVTECQG